jgi:hypothetical protein
MKPVSVLFCGWSREQKLPESQRKLRTPQASDPNNANAKWCLKLATFVSSTAFPMHYSLDTTQYSATDVFKIHMRKIKQDRQCTYNVTLRRVLATIVVMERQ